MIWIEKRFKQVISFRLGNVIKLRILLYQNLTPKSCVVFAHPFPQT